MKALALLMCVALIGCVGMQVAPQSVRDVAIEMRATFNATLNQFNHHLIQLPKETQEEWKQKAIPIATSAVAILNAVDLVAAQNGVISPENTAEFLRVKNQLIDLTAQLILSMKK